MPYYKFAIKHLWIQILLLGILTLIIHYFVLKFIFPGYYSPLYPHHSDFYIPVALAHSSDSFFQYRYLGYSRPLGIFFVKLIGFLGIHGSIMFTILNVVINCILTVSIFCYLLNVKFKWLHLLAYSIYCYLLFSQPFFYTFYTQDVLSHLSYFFLLTGGFCFCKLHKNSILLAFLMLFSTSVIAFLCKETYALVAILFSIIYFFYYRKKELRLAIIPFLATSVAMTIVAIFNFLIKSVFINLKTAPADPYYINLNPDSIYKEIVLYATEGLNYFDWIYIAIICICIIYFLRSDNKKVSYLLAGCLFAVILSWIPNALIPNHHHSGYSFNGAYLLYLPIIFVAGLWNQNTIIRWLALAVTCTSVFSPFLNNKKYESQEWVIEQENSQRNLLRSLNILMNDLKASDKPHKILITGLTMPFYPFHHPAAILYYQNSKFAIYDVVNYSQDLPAERYKSVKFIKPEDTQLKQYDMIWMFSSDGSLLKKMRLDVSLTDYLIKNQYTNLLIHPDKKKIIELPLLQK